MFIILALVFHLFVNDFKSANAQEIPPVVVLEYNDIYTLEYFVPYAKKVSTAYSYKSGRLVNKVWLEPYLNSGVYAVYTYPDADQIKNIQIIVTLRDNKTKTYEPRVLRYDSLYLPLIANLGTPNNQFPAQQEGTITVYEDRVDVVSEIAPYNGAYIKLNSTNGTFVEAYYSNGFSSSFPIEGDFTSAYGYVWNDQTFAYARINFTIIYADIE